MVGVEEGLQSPPDNQGVQKVFLWRGWGLNWSSRKAGVSQERRNFRKRGSMYKARGAWKECEIF